MKIAIDAMGSDKGAQIVVEGSLAALETLPSLEIHLFGDEKTLRALLKKYSNKNIHIHHTTEEILQTDEPVRAARRKKDSSMVRAMSFVKNGEADVVISAGNTGALMSAGIFYLGRIKGIERPALAPIIPTTNKKGTLLLDVGANLEPKPEHLLQYAIMGNLYAQHVLAVSEPKIGLLNIGAEDHKGTDTLKATFPLLMNQPFNFIGNVEAREVPFGAADVVVSDGLSGNIFLKGMEGTAQAILQQLKQALMTNFQSKIGTLLIKSSLKDMKSNLDYTEHGGALLLGLSKPCIKAHGSSNGNAIKTAIIQAVKFVEQDIIKKIEQELN